MLRALMIIAIAIAGCGSSIGPGSNQVGGSCQNDSQCEHRCVVSGHFPNGLCTLSCTNDAQCPSGTACVTDSGGICEVQCGAVNGNCTVFGPSYACDERDRVTGVGAAVCRVP
jgi:hypothetical protein